MKETIENSIKKSLENYEMPYNPDAWKAMSSKLDAVKPVAKPPRYKWYFAASAVAVISVCAYLYYNNASNEQVQLDPNNEIAQNDITSTTDLSSESNQREEQLNDPTFTTNQNDQAIDQDHNSTATANTTSSDRNAGGSDFDSEDTNTNNTANNSSNNSDSNNASGGSDVDNEDKSNDPSNSTDSDITFVLPGIAKDVCNGEKLNIHNTNDVDMTIIYPNGLIWTGKANATTSIKPTVEGTYMVGYMKDETFSKEGSFNVLASPSAQFDFVELDKIYDEKGLPSTNVMASGNATSYEWQYGQATATGKEAIVHLFTRGEHDVKLTVTDVNGCKSTLTKSITIDESYNLMAMNSFIPTDIDPANNTFMPYSLKVRGDDFHMIIIDPNDGHLIYETSDASKGWDGIDKQTGSMVKYETAYIWKVTMVNRKIGESPEYAGTVVPLRSRR